MVSMHNLAYKLILFFTILHYGSSQYYASLVPEPRFGFGILSSLFSGFGGGVCRTSNFQSGTCLDFSRCIATGGRASGSCGFGFKTCCLPALQVTITTRTPTVSSTPTTPPSNTNEYLIKDSPTKLQDSLTIKRISSSYCQLRIDFESFNIDPTNIETGVCSSVGQWTVTGQMEDARKVPNLCGKNSGQHMYLRFDGETPITMRLATTMEDSNWLVKTTQIRCNDPNAAPDGCLQFFTDRTGFVQSFNYQNVERSNEDAYQLANLDYTVCIDMETSPFTKITWTQDTTSLLSFSMSLTADTLGSSTTFMDIYEYSEDGPDCKTDYVIVEEGTYTTNDNPEKPGQPTTKFCGVGFPRDVIATPAKKPFKLIVFTDGNELGDGVTLGDIGNRGFSLKYVLSNV